MVIANFSTSPMRGHTLLMFIIDFVRQCLNPVPRNLQHFNCFGGVGVRAIWLKLKMQKKQQLYFCHQPSAMGIRVS